jgi:hypothetical protein
MSKMPESKNHPQGVNSARIIIKRKPPSRTARSYSMKNLFKFLGITALAAVVGFAMAACSNPAGGPPSGGPPTFVAVTGITNVPTGGVIGTPVDLSTAEVDPADATHKDIVWSVKTPGAGITSVTGTSFTPTAAGTLVLTATIANGLAEGTDYVSPDFTINVSATFKAVTNITGVPASHVVGSAIDMSGVTVTPADATNTAISWSVKDAGTTGLSTGSIAGNAINPTAEGTLVLTATIANGTAQGTNYTEDFTVTVINPVTGISFTNTSGITNASGIDITGITGTSSTAYGVAGTKIDLRGAVVGGGANNSTIAWSGGSISDSGELASPVKNASLTLTATVTNGLAVGTNYVHTLTVNVRQPIDKLDFDNLTELRVSPKLNTTYWQAKVVVYNSNPYGICS